MVANALTATGKFFTLLAVACGLLGLFSLNVAKADPPPACNCGPAPYTTGPAWDAFVTCYMTNCSQCNLQCGPPQPPGSPGYATWVACSNNGTCNFLPSPNFICLACNQPMPCKTVAGNPPTVTCSNSRCTGPVGCGFCNCLPSLFVASDCVCR